MILQRLLKAAFALSVVGFVAPASAHSLTFKTLRVGFGAQATDVWQVECMSDAVLGNSDHLVAQILDRSPGTNLLSLILVKGAAAATSVDPIGGDANPSPFVEVVGGNGIYTMLVNHTQSGNKVYNIEFHCENASGDHTPTTTPSTAVQDN